MVLYILTTSLYYMRSGWISIVHGKLRNSGYENDVWSSAAAAFTSSIEATAYYLDFNTSIIDPSTGPSTRWYGFPLSCLPRMKSYT